MDKDNLFKAIIAAMLAFVLWQMLSGIFFPPPPPPAPAPTDRQVAQQSTRRPALAPRDMQARGTDVESFFELGNVTDDPQSPYPFGLLFSDRGASLVSARLTHHAVKVSKPERYELLSPVEVDNLQPLYSFATEGINLNGNEDNFELADLFWNSKVREVDGGQQAVFWLDFFHAGQEQPFGRLTKTYTLKRQDSTNGHNELDLELKYDNLSDQPVAIIVTQLGPVGVPKEDPRADNRKVAAGVYDGQQITLVPVTNTSLKGGREVGSPLLEGDPQPTLVWAALGNKFFAVIAAPENGDGGWIAAASAVRLSPVEDPDKMDASFKLVSKTLTVAPGQSVTKMLDCYLGPKAKQVFETDPDYARRGYVQLVQADYYWCAWAPIVDVMLWLLNTSYRVIPNYGIAIIILVVVVRTILHPLTKKGQVNMTRMASQMALLQPKMEEIRKKFANDKTRLNQEIMKLYQQEGVNPAGQMLTCLPMMCQMPVWGGLWAALNFTVEMRHQPFCLWIKDLTAPDALFEWATPLPLIGTTFNLLPPLLGISMFLQQRLMPKPAAAVKQGSKTSDQMAQQRMMMYFMSVFMVFIFYNAPSGLSLYIMASNFFGLLEQHRIRKHIKEQEEAEKARGPQKTADKKPFRKPRFLEKLEKMAEDAKKK